MQVVQRWQPGLFELRDAVADCCRTDEVKGTPSAAQHVQLAGDRLRVAPRRLYERKIRLREIVQRQRSPAERETVNAGRAF
jgi:hypothetical protein